jgi:3-phenylpropionate/trans-cinnamate dioxygenase ferredoxin subunit
MKRVSVAGRPLLLVFTDGQNFTVDEMCSQEDYSLSSGCVNDRKIKCSLHGSYLDVVTGRPQEEPATAPIGSYPV